MRRKKTVGANTVRPRSLAAARDRTGAQYAPLHHAPKGSPLRRSPAQRVRGGYAATGITRPPFRHLR